MLEIGAIFTFSPRKCYDLKPCKTFAKSLQAVAYILPNQGCLINIKKTSACQKLELLRRKVTESKFRTQLVHEHIATFAAYLTLKTRKR